MKKVKVMLAGIAVLAVVGGAFAFKAKGAYGSLIFYTNGSSPVNCTLEAQNYTFNPTGTNDVYYTIGASSEECVATSTAIHHVAE